MSARRSRPTSRSANVASAKTTQPFRVRVWIALALVAALVVSVSFLWWPREAPTASGPNILLVTIDTLRADHVGAYGDSHAATPMLDGLARRGVRFTEAVAEVPLTLPSHASIMTGLTPLRHGIRDNPGFVLAGAIPTLAERFKAAGYDTAAFVSGFPLHRRFGLARGFDLYDDRFPRGDDPTRPPYIERTADETAAAVTAWLGRRATRPRPFFVWTHFFDPHAPYNPPEPFRSRFQDHPYDGEVAFTDAQVGRLLGAIEQSGSTSSTVTVVTADHGEGLDQHGEPTHGLFIYDSTMRVPLIVAGPGVPAGRVAASLARGIDIAPTLLDLARVRLIAGIEGRSLRSAWNGGLPDDGAYLESMFARLCCGWAPLHGWREGRWMFIGAPHPELYDIVTDPVQQQNIAADHPNEVERFEKIVRAAVDQATNTSRALATTDAAERLRSLGYVSAGPISRPSLRDPKDVAALWVKLERGLATERSDPRGAIEDFRAVLREDPQNPLARRRLAMTLAGQGQYEEALRELETLVVAGDTSRETWLFMADCYRLAGQPQKAVAVLERASEATPDTADAENTLAKALAASGRVDEARAAFARSLVLVPDDPDALMGLADLAIARGDLPEARARLETLRGRDPRDTAAALKLGTVLVRLDQADQGAELFSQVVQQEPRNAEALVDLGGALAKAGRPGEAVPYLERAVTLGVVNPVVWNALAFARLETGNRVGAAEAMRRSLRLRADQPRIAEALRHLDQTRK